MRGWWADERAEMRIKNWPKFQHYKKRRPPWIKLYRELLDDEEYFVTPDRPAKFLPLIWLLASENHGTLPDVGKIAFRLRIEKDDCAAVLRALTHWIEDDASTMLAGCKQVDALETEREGEKEKEKGSVKTPPVKRFVPPALEEVKGYCFERRNTVDAAKWHSYYSSNGWKVGKNPMKDWKAAVRTWEADGKGPGTLNVPRAKAAKLDGAKKAEIARVLCEGCTVDEFLDKTALIRQALKEAGSVLTDMDEQDVRLAGVEMIKAKGKI